MSKYRWKEFTADDDVIRPMVVKAVKLTEKVDRFIAETCGQSIMKTGDFTTGDYLKMIGDAITLKDEMADFLIDYTEWENQRLEDMSIRIRKCEDQNREILSKLDTLLERRSKD